MRRLLRPLWVLLALVFLFEAWLWEHLRPIVAWIVDRVASTTAGAVGDQRLARRLREISYPAGGLVVDDVTVLAQDVPGADDAQIRKLMRWASPR